MHRRSSSSPSTSSEEATVRRRVRLAIAGTVQGVGFRPHVYRLARSQRIAGWISNTSEGVLLEAEGAPSNVSAFLRRVVEEAPPHAVLASTDLAELSPSGEDVFRIRESRAGAPTAWMLPDLSTCPDCLNDITNPANRRFDYPFTNCTHCGPRFSIIHSLPYDRERTTMKAFKQCSHCLREYADPGDRRFHAQPNACPTCGPQVWLCRPDGHVMSRRSEALEHAARAILSDQVVAVKGLGGFHLVARAGSVDAVRTLRRRKHRGEKPFAVMVRDVPAAELLCLLEEGERAALRSREAPIVLARRNSCAGDCAVLQNPHIAPGNDRLGLMLPYTPLHHLLLRRIDEPIVATSGNLSDEPICTQNDEARARLGDIADLFLMHNRPIERPVDDSVVQIVCGRRQVLRRSRGFSPLPITPRRTTRTTRSHPTLLAVGAHQKNTVALARGSNVFVSQHIGDLDTLPAIRAFEEAAADLPRIYQAPADVLVHDLHPDYGSSQYARDQQDRFGKEAVGVQHHVAHVFSLMAEADVAAPLVAFSWDGTGIGTDGTVWGGECFLVDAEARAPEDQVRRVASLVPFPLVGGDVAAREPRRAAMGLWTAAGKPAQVRTPIQKMFDEAEFRLIQAAAATGLATHETTSAGRLFDGLAALILGTGHVNFEAQAAMALEDKAWRALEGQPLSRFADFESPVVNLLEEDDLVLMDWRPLIAFAAESSQCQEARALGVHIALARGICDLAETYLELPVLVTGGCFQNRLLTELVEASIRERGGTVHFHREVPPNDGGISLGQAVAASVFSRATPFVRSAVGHQ